MCHQSHLWIAKPTWLTIYTSLRHPPMKSPFVGNGTGTLVQCPHSSLKCGHRDYRITSAIAKYHPAHPRGDIVTTIRLSAVLTPDSSADIMNLSLFLPGCLQIGLEATSGCTDSVKCKSIHGAIAAHLAGWLEDITAIVPVACWGAQRVGVKRTRPYGLTRAKISCHFKSEWFDGIT